jgi:hypothetical protein
LHQLVLSYDELFHLRVGIVGLVVAIDGLTITLVVPCVHHLGVFWREDISFLGLDQNPNYMHRKMQMLPILLFFIKR